MFRSAASLRINSKGYRLLHQLKLDKDSYLHHPGVEPLSRANYGQVIEETVNRFPQRVAIRSLHEDITLTYEDLLRQADSLAYALRNSGFEKGDRLGIWSHNCVGWIVTAIAAFRAGLISVLINPLYEASELSYCIKKTNLKGLLVGDDIRSKSYHQVLTQLIPELEKSKPGEIKSSVFPSLSTLIVAGKQQFNGAFSLDTLTRSYQNENVTRYVEEVKSEDGCLIHFTSGTTGNPKAGLDSHLGMVNNTYYSGLRNSFHEGHQITCVQVPLFHALGSVVTTLGGFRHGTTLVLPSTTYSVSANVKALCAEKCTSITGTPTMYVDIISQVKNKGNLPIKLQMALAAGAPCSPELMLQMKNYLNTSSVRSLYGMTETTASVFQSLPEDSVETVAETVGYIQDHVEVQVVDPEGRRVPLGEPGELMVRGYLNMISYWDDPEKTKEAVTEDGWLHTGDKFTISDDGYGRIVGRIKDIIVRGGENIAPKEIEDLLSTHPDVIESQIVGVYDERLGEELCAVLRIRNGSKFSLEDMNKFCSGKIAKFKIPRILKTTEIFPKTASGKIQKFKLKEMVESGKI
ncbi:unnamed protein product [Leptosia nina]|uniref:Medium-chain acyl-CoA ligase ACSF2, mitochondrial n=1 Tax=Leptosia nina TaxID=320188 RepID=A0AAV1JLT0_9NEOP